MKNYDWWLKNEEERRLKEVKIAQMIHNNFTVSEFPKMAVDNMEKEVG